MYRPPPSVSLGTGIKGPGNPIKPTIVFSIDPTSTPPAQPRFAVEPYPSLVPHLRPPGPGGLQPRRQSVPLPHHRSTPSPSLARPRSPRTSRRSSHCQGGWPDQPSEPATPQRVLPSLPSSGTKAAQTVGILGPSARSARRGRLGAAGVCLPSHWRFPCPTVRGDAWGPAALQAASRWSHCQQPVRPDASRRLTGVPLPLGASFLRPMPPWGG